jgi:hypothetical protein
MVGLIWFFFLLIALIGDIREHKRVVIVRTTQHKAMKARTSTSKTLEQASIAPGLVEWKESVV